MNFITSSDEEPEDYQVPKKVLRFEPLESASSPRSVKRAEGEKLPVDSIENADDRNQHDNEFEYKIENSVIINVEGREIDEDDLLDSIEDLCGEDTVIACVPSGKYVFEVTMIDRNCSELLIPDLTIGNTTVSVSFVSEETTFVSIMHLPTYVTDSEIVGKMRGYGIQIMSPIYRKFRRRKRRNKKVADGTRFFRVKFPDTIKSLPWTLSFEVKGKKRYFKTIHDNQQKVCFKCFSADHLVRECPQNKCYSCSEMGHIAMICPQKKCYECNQKDCVCDYGSDTTETNEYQNINGKNETEVGITDEQRAEDNIEMEEVDTETEMKVETKSHGKPPCIEQQKMHEQNQNEKANSYHGNIKTDSTSERQKDAKTDIDSKQSRKGVTNEERREEKTKTKENQQNTIDVINKRLTGENGKASKSEKDESLKSETIGGVHRTQTVRRKKLIVKPNLDRARNKEVKSDENEEKRNKKT